MAENSKIEWTDHTFNTHWGCSEISPGCDNCYAKRLAARFGYGWGDDAAKREFGEKHWDELLRWDRKARDEGVRRRVFTNSMSDLFDKFAPSGVRERHFDYVERTPNLDHLLLTKRIGNVARMVPPRWLEPGGWPANAWLGATVVNQEEADRDIPKLLAVPARVRFLSIEPMLGPINLADMQADGGDAYLDPLTAWTAEEMTEMWGEPTPAHPRIDWVICGGESGPHARPMHPAWARSLRDQCAAAGVPFLFKQWGEWTPDDWGERPGLRDTAGVLPSGEFLLMSAGYVPPFDDGVRLAAAGNVRLDGRTLMDRVGKKAAGRLLDGRAHDGFPQSTLSLSGDKDA